MSDREDGEVLSDGELEDGELPSSDEEEDTAKDEELPNDSPKSPTGSQPESQEAHAALKRPAPEDEAGAAESLPKVVSSNNYSISLPWILYRLLSTLIPEVPPFFLLTSMRPYLVLEMLLNLVSLWYSAQTHF